MPTSPQHNKNNRNKQNKGASSSSSPRAKKNKKFGNTKSPAKSSEANCDAKSTRYDKAHKKSYSKLKVATDSFLEALYEKAEYSEIRSEKSSVKDIQLARKIIKRKETCIGSKALKSLRIAIKLRAYHTDKFYKENSDKGHEFFLKVLRESLLILGPLCNNFMFNSDDYMPVYHQSIGFGEESASVDDKEVSVIDSDIEIADLIRGSENLRVRMLYNTINEMFKQHLEHMRSLRRNIFASNDNENCSMFIALELLQNSFLISHSIEEINDIEEELLDSFPYLNTIYRQIIALNVTELVDDLTDQCNNSTKEEAICILGDILEILLNKDKNKDERINILYHEFCIEHNSTFNFIHEPSSLSYKNYLENLISTDKLFIGFDLLESTKYNIMNTISIIQDIDDILNKFNRQQKSKIKRSSLEKQINNAISVNDLKDILSYDILYVLIDMIKTGELSEYTVGEEKILHIFVELRKYINNPEKKLSFSLIFGLHCLLISLLELKDNQALQTTSKLLKKSFDNYIQQLEKLEKNNSSVQESAENLLQLKTIFSPVTSPLRALIENNCFALWNPVIGSSILMFTMIISNVHCSVGLMNNIGQLNVTTHLYNALLQRNLIRKNEIPFLAFIHDLFLKNNSLWCNDTLPKDEEMVFRYCVSLGFEEKKAFELDQEVFYAVAQPSVNNEVTERDARRFNDKKFFQVQPEDISKSYEKVYLEKFENGLAENSLKSLEERINLTISNLEKEAMLLSFNFLVVGAKFERFFQDLFRHLKWDEDVSGAIHRIPSLGLLGRPAKEHNFMQHMLVYKLLGKLDYMSDEGLRNSREIQSTISFMKSYFNNMEPSEYALF